MEDVGDVGGVLLLRVFFLGIGVGECGSRDGVDVVDVGEAVDMIDFAGILLMVDIQGKYVCVYTHGRITLCFLFLGWTVTVVFCLLGMLDGE